MSMESREGQEMRGIAPTHVQCGDCYALTKIGSDPPAECSMCGSVNTHPVAVAPCPHEGMVCVSPQHNPGTTEHIINVD